IRPIVLGQPPKGRGISRPGCCEQAVVGRHLRGGWLIREDSLSAVSHDLAPLTLGDAPRRCTAGAVDADLAEILAAWRSLSATERAAVLAIVRRGGVVVNTGEEER